MSDLSMLSTYTDVEDAMRGVVQEEFHQDVFFQTLQRGQYTMAQIRHFAIQYSYYSRHFPVCSGRPSRRWHHSTRGGSRLPTTCGTRPDAV